MPDRADVLACVLAERGADEGHGVAARDATGGVFGVFSRRIDTDGSPRAVLVDCPNAPLAIASLLDGQAAERHSALILFASPAIDWP